MKFDRSGGILLHPTSLAGPYGIGDLGSTAFRWIDWLESTGCKLWQILPLGPTGYGDSPYQCFSAFAGNPYLIGLDSLLEEGLLTHEDFGDMPKWNSRHVDFGLIYRWKPGILRKAFERFFKGDVRRNEYEAFIESNKYWLDDYALFMALKAQHGGGTWLDWEPGLRQRDPEFLKNALESIQVDIALHSFLQYLFFKQWNTLKAYANAKSIKIIGDIPIFVAMDSSDVWKNPHLFHLNEDGKPTVVAGVPPDYFSPTGQLWGNPLYRWQAHEENNFSWWMERIRFSLKTCDIIRIDHFRGFERYWEIPGDAVTAENGRWVPGPGERFFKIVQKNFGDLPFIAEDLGEITPEVVDLRDAFHLPGMKVLQFAFTGPDNPFLPHRHSCNSIVFTGTHDNETTCGWYASATEKEKDFCRRYLGKEFQTESEFCWNLIRTAWISVASFAIAPMQDFLTLGPEARFNFPSKVSGNWTWRMIESDYSEDLRKKIREINWLYQR